MLQKSHWLSVVFGETWVAALAVVAVMHLSQLDKAHASDGYLQIEVTNHPNNAKLGNLYLYIHSYSSSAGQSPTNIPMYSNSQTAGGGYNENGSGVTYLVDDYIWDGTLSSMPEHGPIDPNTARPTWRGFRVDTPHPAGASFMLGFGCDERQQTLYAEYSDLYNAGHGVGACISYDAGKRTDDTGDVFQADIAWASNYESQKGFNQRFAVFEAAHYGTNQGNDLANLTSINFYGFPMSVEAAFKNQLADPWTQTTSKNYLRNDQWLRNNLRSLMANGGTGWYYTPSIDGKAKFVRAVSPQSFPVIPQAGWNPLPPKLVWPSEYLDYLKLAYPCGTDNYIIEGPVGSGPGLPWTGTSGIVNSFKCSACFKENGDLLMHDFVVLTNSDDQNVVDLITEGYSLQCTIPNTLDAVTGWTYMERFILSGDPGGSNATVEYKSPGSSTWNTVDLLGGNAYTINGVSYTASIKSCFRHASFPIQFGWLGNHLPVKLTDDAYPGGQLYTQSDDPDAIAITTLPTGKMQFIKPIYEFEKADGSSAEWFDQYAATVMAAQNPSNMATYVTGYSDSYKYGNVQFGSHDGLYNRIQLSIPDLTSNCYSDFNNDGINNPPDVLILLNSWGSVSCDLNGDSMTNVHDLLLLLKDWGKCAPA